MTDDPKTAAAVYVAWPTFKNAIEQLSQGVPNVIDRTVFPGFSGGVQAQLFAGMRFLGLIDEYSKPTPLLKELASRDESVRKAKLKQILENSYPDLFALDLKKTTPAQALDRMRTSYGVSGDTAGKAMRFFLSASEYVGIPVSPLFSSTTRSRNSTKVANGAPRRRGRKAQPKPPNNGSSQEPPATTGESKTVSLRSGGTLTISASLGWLSLSTEDRNFVFELIDKLAAYENQTSLDDNGQI